MEWDDRSGRIRHEGAVLLWRQVYDDLLALIDSGELAPDEKLPADYDLENIYGVSRPTIRRALFELRGERRVVVLIGKGTYVAAR